MINHEVQFSINKMLKDENRERNIDLFLKENKGKKIYCNDSRDKKMT
jgi:hypothetical protein